MARVRETFDIRHALSLSLYGISFKYKVVTPSRCTFCIWTVECKWYARDLNFLYVSSCILSRATLVDAYNRKTYPQIQEEHDTWYPRVFCVLYIKERWHL